MAWEIAMPQIVENTPQRLEVQSGSTRIVLDKQASTATLLRKFIFVPLKPAVVPLSDVEDIRLNVAVDAASHVELFRVALQLGSGGAWVLSANDKADAQSTVGALREFVGMPQA
jgi:hypothetical protein